MKAETKRTCYRLLFVFFVVMYFFISDKTLKWFSESYNIGISRGWCLPWDAYLIQTKREGVSRQFVRGDLIAFKGDQRMPEKFQKVPVIKMVLGLPGDRIVIRDDWIWLNGEPYDRMWLAQNVLKDFVVREGHYFVVGTHRDSLDSRYFGLVAADAVIGQAWPLF